MTDGMMPPDIRDGKESDSEQIMTWAGHLTELRSRLFKVIFFFILAFLAVYPLAGRILDFLMIPLARAMNETGGSQRVIFTGLAEGFITHLKLAAFAGVVLSVPFGAFQLWRFIAPGLYPQEKAFVRVLFVASPVLFIIGGLFVFYALMPLAFRFLLSFQQLSGAEIHLPVVLEARLSEYLSFLTALILAFGFSFQLPVVLVILVRMGVISLRTLIAARRYAVVFIFILAAVLTPPDIISQFALAVPLLFLYEMAIWCIGYLEKKKNQVYK